MTFYCSLTDQIEMALFILRYVSNLLIFALGLRAPGISNFDSDYRTLNDDTIMRSQYYRERVSDIQYVHVVYDRENINSYKKYL